MAGMSSSRKLAIGCINQRMKSQLTREARKYPVIAEWNILKGDTVHIISGEGKGKVGKVSSIVRSRGAVVVEGMKLQKRVVRTYVHRSVLA